MFWRQLAAGCSDESTIANMNTILVDPLNKSRCRDIASALSRSSPGDIIVVAEGRYQGNLVIRHSVEIRAKMEGRGVVIAGSIRVEGQTVRLGLKGCSIETSEDSGVILLEQSVATVHDCTFSENAKYGVRLAGNSRLEASRCTFRKNGACGVSFVEQSSGTLDSCILAENGKSGIAVGNSASVSVTQCELSMNTYNGLWLNPGTSAKIERSSIHHNKASGLGVNGGHLEAKNCDIYANEDQGIYFSKATGNVEECKVRGNCTDGIQTGQGSKPTILKCEFLGNGRTGVFAYSNAKGSIEDCVFSGKETGEFPWITINGSTTKIRNCRVSGSKGIGILLRDHASSAIENIDCFENAGPGIQIESQSEATITGSRIYGNKAAGIQMSEQSKATIEDSEVKGNATTGIDVKDCRSTSIRRSRLQDNGQNGLFASVGAEVEVEECDIAGSSEEYPGITINAARALILKSRIHDNKNYGICFRDDAKGVVEETECFGNACFGALISKSEVLLRQCRAHDNSRGGVFVITQATATIDDCHFWQGGASYSAITVNDSKVAITNSRVNDIQAAGVYLSEKAVGTIENCTVSGCTGAGILLDTLADVEIRGCKCVTNTAQGILLLGKSKALVRGSNFSGNKFAGMQVDAGSELTAAGCRSFDNSLNGIYASTDSTLTIKGCKVWGGGADYSGIVVDHAKATIAECGVSKANSVGILFRNQAKAIVEESEFEFNRSSGVQIASGSEVTLKNCRVHDNGGNGIHLLDKATATLERCEVWGGGDGFPGIIVSASTASIVDSRVYETRSQGIYFIDASKGLVSNCKIWRNEVGGIGVNGSEVEIVKCQVQFNDSVGVWVFASARVKVSECFLTNNIGPGAIVERNATTDFAGCTITENAGYGISFREKALGSVKDSKMELNDDEGIFNDGTAEVGTNEIGHVVTERRSEPIATPATKEGTIELTDAEAELNRLVGLDSVKQTMKKVRGRVQLAKGDITKLDALHALFLGGPGTGKTTVARLMGRILHGLGAIKSPKVIECGRKDLVAQFIGQTAQRTQQKIEEAVGGVLFIDEAYALINPQSGQDFGQEALETLLPEMERRRHELVVICAGYPERMDSFIRSNPGLDERFRYRFYFDDFKPDELMLIFDGMLKDRELTIEVETREIVKKEFKARYDARGEGFANGRMVRNFIADALDNLGLRVQEEEPAEVVLTKADVSPLCGTIPPESRPPEIMLSELNKLVGLDRLKQRIRVLVERINYERTIADKDHVPFENPTLHSLFLGSPGTGKTTVAGLMGEVYRSMGLLSRGHVVIVSDRSQIIGQYLGHTAPLVQKRVQEAMGGVLFIDEAYNLISDEHDSFGREAVGVLNTEMEKHRGRFAVIAAGYEREMNAFLQVNTGFQSRFPESNHFYFDDYSPDALIQILQKMVTARGMICEASVLPLVRSEFTTAWQERSPNFANGRAVRNYFDDVMAKVAQRCNRLPASTPLEVLKTITPDDVEGIELSRGKIGRDIVRPPIGFGA